MPFVEAGTKLSDILDRVAEQGDIYVVAKRKKPVAAKHMKEVGGKRILKIRGIATAAGDIDEAIRALRKSRLTAAGRSM